MPAGRARRRRLYRLDQRHDRLGAQEQAEARRDGHRMLDGRQREGGIARRRVRQAVQSLPAHEADHAAEDSRQPRLYEGGSRDRSADRRQRAALGRAGDVTSTATVPAGTRGRGVLVARKAGTIAGLPLVEETLRKLDPGVSITAHKRDGTAVEAKTKLMTIEADARALLTAERTALN